MKLALYLVLAFTFLTNLHAQDAIVTENLKLVAMGKVDEVKNKIPDLLVEYPNDPGITLLHAVVIEDAFKALALYSDIVQNYPDSQWADDALWRIVQIEALAGNLDRAKDELNTFRRRYPTSPFLAPAADVVRAAESIAAKSPSRSVVITTEPDPKMDSRQVDEPKVAKTMVYTEENTWQEAELDRDELVKKRTEVRGEVTPTIKPKPIEVKTTQSTEPVEIIENKKMQPDTRSDEPTTVTEVIIAPKTEPQPIEVTVIEPTKVLKTDKEVASMRLPDGDSGFYGLQVGIFADPLRADEEMEKFLARRMRTEVLEKQVDGQTLYAVVIGKYSSMESAKAAKIIVEQQCNCEPIIFQK